MAEIVPRIEELKSEVYHPNLAIAVYFYEEIKKLYNKGELIETLVDGIITDCGNKNSIKVKLRDGSQITTKAGSHYVKNGAWVLLIVVYKDFKYTNSTTISKIPKTEYPEIKRYDLIGVRFFTAKGQITTMPVYSV